MSAQEWERAQEVWRKRSETYEWTPVCVPETNAQDGDELRARHQEKHEVQKVSKLIEQHLFIQCDQFALCHFESIDK